MDFGPAVPEVAGLARPGGMQARPRVFAEHARGMTLEGTACMTAGRDRRRKPVHVVDSPEGRLFDLDADPREVRNLWDDPAFADRRRDLIEEVLRWRTPSALNPAPLPAPAR